MLPDPVGDYLQQTGMVAYPYVLFYIYISSMYKTIPFDLYPRGAAQMVDILWKKHYSLLEVVNPSKGA